MDHEPITMPADGPTDATRDSVQAVVRFLRVLAFHKLYILASMVVAGLLGGVHYVTAQRVYEAHASLMVLQSGAEVWDAAMSADGGRQALIPTYEKLFSKDVVLQGAVRYLQGMPAGTRIDFEDLPVEDWPQVMKKHLTTNAVRQTNIIDLSYLSRSPQGAEAVVEAVVRSYLDFMERNHKDVSLEIVTILDKERQQVEERLATKQRELLKLQHRVADLGLNPTTHTVHPALQRVLGVNDALIQVRKERVNLEASLAAIRTAMGRGGDLRQHLLTVEPIVGREMLMSGLGLSPQSIDVTSNLERKLIDDRAKLKTLEEHYGPVHFRVVELRRAIENTEQYLADSQTKTNSRLAKLRDGQLGPTLAAMVEEKLNHAWEHERELLKQYTVAEQEAVHLNDRRAELTIVELDLQRLRSLYDSLLERISNIDLKQNHADVRVAIVTEPTALPKPVAPKLSIVILVCLFGGTSVGAAFVYCFDLLDDRFRSPEELRDQLGVPVLAVVRDLPLADGDDAGTLQVHIAAQSVESEAFRTLRAALAFSGSELQRLAITSAEPGDGKTTVLSNLGASFAQVGKRTLLIDADMRRPGLTRLFGMRKAGGVSEIIRGHEEVRAMCDRLLQPTAVDNLFVMPCGPKPSNPSELLSHARFADIIAWAETNFDQVLIDCPPILAASDAAIVGRATDGTMLVVQPEKNHRRLVIRAAESLLAVQAKLVGIVANRVTRRKEGGYGYGYGQGYGYGFGYGYGYGYDDGYGADVETEVETSEPEPAEEELEPQPTPPTQPLRVAVQLSEPEVSETQEIQQEPTSPAPRVVIRRRAA